MRLFPLFPKFTINAMQVNADITARLQTLQEHALFFTAPEFYNNPKS